MKAQAHFLDADAQAPDWEAFLNEQATYTKALNKPDYDDFRERHALALSCDPAMQITSELRHNVLDKTAYDSLMAGITDNPIYSFSWDDLMKFLSDNNMSCYDGYLGFDINGSQMSLRRSDDYRNTESLYPSILFEAIPRVRVNAGTPVSIHFTWGNIVVRQRGKYNQVRRIVFHVEFIDSAGRGTRFYYDMSDDPT